MGSFSVNCGLTGMTINYGDKATLIVMKPRESEQGNETYGSTLQVSNDATTMHFTPVWYPIHGKYDDYGRLSNIVRDDNVKILEKFYDLPIQDLVNVVTSGRKSDKFDDDLKCIIDPKTGKYLEKYVPILHYSGMWVHGEVYEQLTSQAPQDDYDRLDLGTPELLEFLGFEEQTNSDPVDAVQDGSIEDTKKTVIQMLDSLLNNNKERYNRVFKNGPVTLYSDGRWLNGSIYTLSNLKELCAEQGLDIDISEINGLTAMEQAYKLVFPNFEIPVNPSEVLAFFQFDTNSAQFGYLRRAVLNFDRYSRFWQHGPSIQMEYYYAIKRGELEDAIARFSKFDMYMYSLGRFYHVVGTGPQDGEPEWAQRVFDVAASVNRAKFDDE